MYNIYILYKHKAVVSYLKRSVFRGFYRLLFNLNLDVTYTGIITRF